MPEPKDDGICKICKLRHDQIGYMPTAKHPIEWCCLECLNTHTDAGSIVKVAYRMRNFDSYERAAIEAGGNKGGEYLDHIGKTDLATLRPDEYQTFLAEVFKGYVTNIRATLAGGKAPF